MELEVYFEELISCCKRRGAGGMGAESESEGGCRGGWRASRKCTTMPSRLSGRVALTLFSLDCLYFLLPPSKAPTEAPLNLNFVLSLFPFLFGAVLRCLLMYIFLDLFWLNERLYL